MRSHLRAATVVLISLLSLSQAIAVVCEAACGPQRAPAVSTHAEEPACHSAATPASDGLRISGSELARCDHELPLIVISPAGQHDKVSLRQTADELAFLTATAHTGLHGVFLRRAERLPVLQASAVFAPPLRI